MFKLGYKVHNRLISVAISYILGLLAFFCMSFVTDFFTFVMFAIIVICYALAKMKKLSERKNYFIDTLGVPIILLVSNNNETGNYNIQMKLENVVDSDEAIASLQEDAHYKHLHDLFIDRLKHFRTFVAYAIAIIALNGLINIAIIGFIVFYRGYVDYDTIFSLLLAIMYMPFLLNGDIEECESRFIENGKELIYYAHKFLSKS